MNFAEFAVRRIAADGVKDIFGVPGMVIGEFLLQAKNSKLLNVHLAPNENSAGFSAIGAAASQKYGVAFCTKGPGFTNILTAMNSAYSDCVPTLFICGHQEAEYKPKGVVKQEVDFQNVAKTLAREVIIINSIEDACSELKRAISETESDICGSVFVSVLQSVFQQEVPQSEIDELNDLINSPKTDVNNSPAVENGYIYPSLIKLEMELLHFLERCDRPIFLAGNGILQSKTAERYRKFAQKLGLPVLTSRQAMSFQKGLFSEDGVNLAGGYVGSNGNRAGNIILNEADFVLAIGNRLGYNLNSESFGDYFENRSLFWFKDHSLSDKFSYNVKAKTEFNASLYLPENDLLNAATRILRQLPRRKIEMFKKWREVCENVAEELKRIDESDLEKNLTNIFETVEPEFVASGIGMNERWTANALFRAQVNPRLLYTQWMGVVGSSISQAVGACIGKDNAKTIAVLGDYGMHYEIADLGYISARKLPILIVIIKNKVMRTFINPSQNEDEKLPTVDEEMGLVQLDFEKIANAFNIDFCNFENGDVDLFLDDFLKSGKPHLLQIDVDSSLAAEPVLKRGAKLDDMFPKKDLQAVFDKFKSLKEQETI